MAQAVKTPFMVHDHFEGSAHCVECRGPCQLTGAELAYTELVRAVFEDIAFNGLPPNLFLRGTLADAGVNFDYFLERAKEQRAREASAG